MSDLTAKEIDGVESDLNKLGTPPDNIFRRMIAEIRRRRKTQERVTRVNKRSL